MFNVGDKVICINNSEREKELSLNSVYTISVLNGNSVKLSGFPTNKQFFNFRFKKLKNKVVHKTESDYYKWLASDRNYYEKN